MASTGAKLYEKADFTEAPPFSNSSSAFTMPARVKSSLHAHKFLAISSDLLVVLASGIMALVLRFPVGKILNERMRQDYTGAVHLAFLVLYALLVVMFCNNQRLYSRFQLFSRQREILAVIHVVFMAGLLLTGSIYVSGVKVISRMVIGSVMLSTLVGMISWRSLRRHYSLKSGADGVSRHNVLIVGDDFLAEGLQQYLEQHSELGLVVAGLLSVGQNAAASALGTLADLARICQTRFIDEIIICAQSRETVKHILEYAQSRGVGVRIVPDLYDGIAMGAPVDYLGSFPTMAIHNKHIPAVSLALKRSMDIIVSVLGLIAIAPLLVAIAVAIRLDSPGPILYSSKRVGKKGRIFECLKFRTMFANAEQMKAQLSHLNERDGILFKIAADPRITRLGRFLRKYSLDELPQMLNVLRGEMSIVGPRPPLANEVELYKLEYLRRLEVAPGITGLWQVEARAHPSFDRYISLDLQYVSEWNLLMDLKILVRTVSVVFAGTGS